MRLLVDSDFLIGLFRDDDPNHKKSVILMNKRFGNNEMIVSNLVIQETATVLSHRSGMDAVRLFWQKLPKLDLINFWTDKEVEQEGWKIFLKQNKKKSSYVDCANLAIIQKLKLDGILCFDKFYPKNLRIV